MIIKQLLTSLLVLLVLTGCNTSTNSSDTSKNSVASSVESSSSSNSSTSQHFHTAGDPVIENKIEASCTKDGSYDLVTYCTVDNFEMSREHKTVTALGHDYGEFVIDKAPTISENGSKHRTCSRCNHIEYQLINATGTVDKLSFEFDAEEKGYTVSPLNEYVSGEVVVPELYNDYPVIRVSKFNNCSLITSIVLPDTIKYFSCTFENCIGLEKIVLPASLTTIRANMFYNCISLREVNIPSGLESVGASAFCKCSLVSITFPDSLTKVERDAFCDCDKLEVLNFGKNVSNINERAFNFSSNVRGVLKEVNIDPNNNYYSSVDGVLYNKDKTVLLYCPNGKEGELNIPSTVTAIGPYSFRCCNKLTSIHIPNSVLIIKQWAFHDLGNKSFPFDTITIDLPTSIKAIENGGFCSAKIVVINYQGTKEEWSKVILGEYWDTLASIKVECTDGVVNY